LVFRVILFEKLSTVFMLLWWVMIVSIAIIGSSEWMVVVGAIAAGLLLYRPVWKMVLGCKYRLVCRGDTVEYSEPSESFSEQKFETVKVLRFMTAENVAASESFEPEYLDLYRHFYLVDTGKKNRVIPYEWIMTIETGELEL
jgi:hypothetical protein